jgi:hypothetical protein
LSCSTISRISFRFGVWQARARRQPKADTDHIALEEMRVLKVDPPKCEKEETPSPIILAIQAHPCI